VPADNPADVETAADLAEDGLKLVLAAPEVPVGRYARESLAKMAADPSFEEAFGERVLANVVSEEANVKAVVTKVQLGEAEAAIVYRTDVTPDVQDDVTAVEIAEAYNIDAMYPIAVTADASNAEAAEAFIGFVLSGEGQAILERHGFLRAP
jgi:molybdate transport system substrate-binding protein